MKILKIALLAVVLCAAAHPQTKDLGLGAFANEAGPILLAVDAQAAIQQINSPYVLFVLYMAAKGQDQSFVVSRNDVVMVYKGQEYKMPSIEEFRKNYNAEIRDIEFYRHLAKAGIISSWVRFYKFTTRTDFFPPLTLRSALPVDEGSMTGTIGFSTKCYFKNPGFQKGDKLTIKVRDKKDPEITAEVEVTLK